MISFPSERCYFHNDVPNKAHKQQQKRRRPSRNSFIIFTAIEQTTHFLQPSTRKEADINHASITQTHQSCGAQLPSHQSDNRSITLDIITVALNKRDDNSPNMAG